MASRRRSNHGFLETSIMLLSVLGTVMTCSPGAAQVASSQEPMAGKTEQGARGQMVDAGNRGQTTKLAPGGFMRGAGFWPTDGAESYLNTAFGHLMKGTDIACVQRTEPFEDVTKDFAPIVHDWWLKRARAAGLKTCISFEAFDGDRSGLRVPKDWTGAKPGLANTAWQAAYRKLVLDTAKRYKPDYFNIAVEANMHYRYHPEDWETFRVFFASLRREIKELSPGTKVFCSYQFEILRGRFTGENSAPQWELLGEKAVEQDVLALSSYPLFRDGAYAVGELADDYFQSLSKYTTDLPLFFSELGWYSAGDVRPQSSPASQAAFIARIPELLHGLDVEAVCWISLCDLRRIPALKPLEESFPEFFSLGLLDSELEPKPGWAAWQALWGREAAEPEAARFVEEDSAALGEVR